MTHQKRKYQFITAVVCASVISFTAAAGWAQSARNCGPRDKVIDTLAQKYGESRQSVGLGANNSLIETYASNKTGSWTITSTNAQGMTCLVASGQSYEALTEVLPPQENDA